MEHPLLLKSPSLLAAYPAGQSGGPQQSGTDLRLVTAAAVPPPVRTDGSSSGYDSPRSPGDRREFIQIEITVFKGRKLETKRQRYQLISKSIAAQLDISEHAPLILLVEQEPENWGMRGGVPASEIDFGYAISI